MINRRWIDTIVCLPLAGICTFRVDKSSVRHQVLITRQPHFFNNKILMDIHPHTFLISRRWIDTIACLPPRENSPLLELSKFGTASVLCFISLIISRYSKINEGIALLSHTKSQAQSMPISIARWPSIPLSWSK